MDDGGFQTFCVETEDHKTHAFCLENAHMVYVLVGLIGFKMVFARPGLIILDSIDLPGLVLLVLLVPVQ